MEYMDTRWLEGHGPLGSRIMISFDGFHGVVRVMHGTVVLRRFTKMGPGWATRFIEAAWGRVKRRFVTRHGTIEGAPCAGEINKY